MARVTVEDCVDKVPNRFDLVLLAAQRAREISGGSELTIDRDRDKNPVVALREIAEETGIEGVELIVPCHASRWGFDVPEKYSVAYLARAKGRPEAVLPEHDDHGAARWVPWREALELEFIHPKQAGVLAEVVGWAKRLEVLNDRD